MKLRSGFSLIELLIATFVAALLTGFLFTGYWQLQKAMQRFDVYTQRHGSIELVERILSRDLMGAFVPLTVLQKDAQKNKKKKDVDREVSDDTKAQPITKVFIVEGSQELTTSCTFITNNVLSGYVIEGMSDPKPWIVRVSYKLEKEKEGSYRLLRQQSHDLDAASSQPWHILAQDIQTFTMTLIRYEQSDEDSKKMNQIESFTWSSDEAEPCQEGPCYVPDLVLVKINFAKRGQASARSYVFSVPIIAHATFSQAKTIDSSEKKQEQKNNASTDQSDKNKKGPSTEEVIPGNSDQDRSNATNPGNRQPNPRSNPFGLFNITFDPGNTKAAGAPTEKENHASS